MYFTTFFDKNYLAAGSVLIDSLKQHCSSFKMYVLCLDQVTFDFFQNNTDYELCVIPIHLDELEEFDTELKECKLNRKLVEYYFTLSPCLPLYLLKKYKLPFICSLDADILFFSSPAPIFNLLEKHSIIITPHKFSEELKHMEGGGKYNVSFQLFKNNETGVSCLENWRNECIEWCKDEIDYQNERFADQLYLNKWENRYGTEVYILKAETAGIAPWNVNNYSIGFKNNTLYVDDQVSIFYHFQAFKILNKNFALNSFNAYGCNVTSDLKALYSHYWHLIDNKPHLSTSGIRHSDQLNFNYLRTKTKGLFFRIFGKLFYINTPFIRR